ncbi:MAG: hypothetical protein ACYC26_15005 [Phycisphaerales bacterium]
MTSQTECVWKQRWSFFQAGMLINDDIYYLLGPDRSFSRMDSETLFVRFGTDGKAVRQGLTRD